MTNKEALAYAIDTILEGAPTEDVEACAEWLDAEFKPKTNFELIPILQKVDLTSLILKIIDKVNAKDPDTSTVKVILNFLDDSPFSKFPDVQVGDILYNGTNFVVLNDYMILNISTNDLVSLSAIKDSIISISRPTQNGLKKIFER